MAVLVFVRVGVVRVVLVSLAAVSWAPVLAESAPLPVAASAQLPNAQTAAPAASAVLSGRLVNSLSGEAIPAAVVTIEELRRQATSSADGSFSFAAVPVGTYHLIVRADGYSSRRMEVQATAIAAAMEIPVDPELHFEEILSVSADARSQFDAFQPTSVLAGQELTKQLGTSLGATLENQTGVTTRSFGPAPARPVIRGLDGDRVLILQDGQRMGDLSSQSGDHGITVNPAAASRIEVVRGPATLLYGANAIGGLVNVITNDIPTARVTGASGNVTLDLGTVANEAGGAADLLVGNGTVALHAGGGGRTSGDVGTPEGEVLNSQSRSGFGNVGLSWTGTKSYLGASYGYDDTKYGIPVVEDGGIQLTPRRHSFSIRGGGQNLSGAFDAVRATFSARRYAHEELEGSAVGTAFSNDTSEFEIMGAHRALGRVKGSVGGWFLERAFDAVGAEALSPAVDQRSAAAFIYEEVTWPHVTVQFGGRVDHTRYQPFNEAARPFMTGSGSVGLLLRPAAADDRITVAVSVARAARTPALEELFFYGTHTGNFAFEVGNPGLDPEHALGVDVSLRWRSPRASGELTYFRNDIRNFVFRRVMTADELQQRLGEFDGRFPGRDIADEGIDDVEFPIVEQIGADSVLQGLEAHTDLQLSSRVLAEVGFDYVRGTVKETGGYLPRIPPVRVRGGLRYQYNAFQTGGDIVVAARQDRLSDGETATDGYGLLKLYAAYSFESRGAVNTITARLDNATNQLYRNHLSLIKAFVPEMGRGFRLLYNVKF
jgi:iron complex outermembrane receptor protein